MQSKWKRKVALVLMALMLSAVILPACASAATTAELTARYGAPLAKEINKRLAALWAIAKKDMSKLPAARSGMIAWALANGVDPSVFLIVQNGSSHGDAPKTSKAPENPAEETGGGGKDPEIKPGDDDGNGDETPEEEIEDNKELEDI